MTLTTISITDERPNADPNVFELSYAGDWTAGEVSNAIHLDPNGKYALFANDKELALDEIVNYGTLLFVKAK